MKKFSLLLCLLASLCMPLSAQKANTRDYITTQFVPNHSDWNYSLGEQVIIELSVRRAYCPMPGMEVRLEWGPELRDPEKSWTITTPAFGVTTLKLAGSKVPGFKTLKAVVSYEGKEYTNIINLAFAPDRIQPTTQCPSDFDEFWTKTLAAARKVPLSPVVNPAPEQSTAEYEAFEFRFCNDAKNRYMYGLMMIPRSHDGRADLTTKHPVLIEWPGAGVKPHRGIQSHLLAKGFIVIEMGVNGLPVIDENDELYLSLRNGALRDYGDIRLDSREDYYYHSIYTGTVRTIDFLETLSYVDADRIAVSGGSQGGALSIVHAGLDKRVKVCAAAYPALSEMAGYYHGRVSGWPHLFSDYGYRDAKKKTVSAKEKAAVSEYYDVVNFARRLTQPTMIFIGYNDHVCCPTSTLSAFNAIPMTDKRLYVAQDCAHWQYPEHKQMRHQFVADHLK